MFSSPDILEQVIDDVLSLAQVRAAIGKLWMPKTISTLKLEVTVTEVVLQR